MANLSKWIALAGARPAKDDDDYRRYKKKADRLNDAGGDDYWVVFGVKSIGRRP